LKHIEDSIEHSNGMLSHSTVCESFTKNLWLSKRLLLGQVVSFAVSGTGVFTTLLVNRGQSFPLLQSATAYLWIVVLFVPAYLYMLRKLRDQGPNYGEFRNFAPFTRLWRYPLIAVVDLEANYVVVKAYQYTDMTSVQLLDCSTIPFVMILSFLFLRVRYTKYHGLGAVVAVAGLGMLIGIDADGLSRTAAAPNPLLGDLLCFVSSACYAISNVACEKLIKVEVGDADDVRVEGGDATPGLQVVQAPGDKSDTDVSARSTGGPSPSAQHTTVTTPLTSPTTQQHQQQRAAYQGVLASQCTSVHNATESGFQSGANMTVAPLLPAVPAWLPVLEYLACMPACGLVFALIQLSIVEWPSLHSSLKEGWPDSSIAYQLMFGVTMVFVYTGMPVLFFCSSATFANLSLLTADVYSVIWNVAIFSIKPRWEFFLAYAIIVIGIVVFDTKGLEGIRRRFYRALPTSITDEVA
jgi:solute carrier family 35, member F1/2